MGFIYMASQLLVFALNQLQFVTSSDGQDFQQLLRQLCGRILKLSYRLHVIPVFFVVVSGDLVEAEAPRFCEKSREARSSLARD